VKIILLFFPLGRRGLGWLLFFSAKVSSYLIAPEHAGQVLGKRK
jgi:hypothetical protein